MEKTTYATTYALQPIKGSDEDGAIEPLWALVPSDEHKALVIDEESIAQIHATLGRWLDTGKHDGWLDSEDYQLATWVNVSDALKRAKQQSRFADGPFPRPSTVRKALRDGRITPSEKIGVEGRAYWEFSLNRFNAWLRDWQIERREYLEQQQRHADMSLGGLYDPESVPIFPLRPDCELLIFDLDGTLADRDSLELYEHMKHWFDYWIKRDGKIPAIAIATNQGGPACFDAGWGDQFPAYEDIDWRVRHIKKQIPVQVLLNVCYAFEDRDGNIRLPNAVKPGDFGADIAWRKPAPGMILNAMNFYNIDDPCKVWMVGDRDEDEGAARAAGVNFLRVKNGWVVPDRI